MNILKYTEILSDKRAKELKENILDLRRKSNENYYYTVF
jgi:hypothetical protein